MNFVFVCLKKWHKVKICKEEIIDKKLNKWKKEKNSKRCPNFIFLIKYEGCNNITLLIVNMNFIGFV